MQLDHSLNDIISHILNKIYIKEKNIHESTVFV